VTGFREQAQELVEILQILNCLWGSPGEIPQGVPPGAAGDRR